MNEIYARNTSREPQGLEASAALASPWTHHCAYHTNIILLFMFQWCHHVHSTIVQPVAIWEANMEIYILEILVQVPLGCDHGVMTVAWYCTGPALDNDYWYLLLY